MLIPRYCIDSGTISYRIRILFQIWIQPIFTSNQLGPQGIRFAIGNTHAVYFTYL